MREGILNKRENIIYFDHLLVNNLIELDMKLLNELKNVNDESKIRGKLISYYKKMELPNFDDYYLKKYPDANLPAIEKNVKEFLVEGFILFLKFIKKDVEISRKNRIETISKFLYEIEKPTTFHSDNSAYRHLITVLLKQYEEMNKSSDNKEK